MTAITKYGHPERFCNEGNIQQCYGNLYENFTYNKTFVKKMLVAFGSTCVC